MGKNIVLCSDGTGNRWGVGAQTNVSKMFQAIDTDVKEPRQIRYYDNGVGTSSNRYLRAITGAFGFGLRRNVLDLYEFLARHWQPGDKVYLFGFSRGAATVRALAGMLQEVGLVYVNGDHPDCKSYDEQRLDELLTLAKDAYRHRKPSRTDANKPHRKRFEDSVKASGGGFEHEPEVPIKMVGVWDTVSALGFPTGPYGLKWLFDVLEGVADFFFPHSFYEYQLDGRVEAACHALAIDDERRTFRPTLFNEIDGPGPGTIEQVWFPGMHADVGGGYPRSGLASVSLEWMMAQAEHRGLHLRSQALDDVHRDANPCGKMHNSRDGLKIFYRYMPRDLVRLSEHGTGPMKASGAPRYGSKRYPVAERPMVKRGDTKLHESVLERSKEGTARYAPGLLPSEFKVVGNPSQTGPASSRSVDLNPADWSRTRGQVLRSTLRRSQLYHVFLYSALALAFWMVDLWLGLGVTGFLCGLLASFGDPGPVERIFHWLTPGDTGVRILGFLDGPIESASRLAEVITGGLFLALQQVLQWPLPAIVDSLLDLALIEEPFLFVAILLFGGLLFFLRGRFLAGFYEATNETRKVLLRRWAAIRGRAYIEKPVVGVAPAEPKSAKARFLELAFVALGLAILVGSFRLSFASDAAQVATVTALKMVLLPTLAIALFAAIFRQTGRDAGQRPLNSRFEGYKAPDFVADAKERELKRYDNYTAERRFLVADLFFPVAYGLAFAFSIAVAAHHLGWESGWRWLWLIVLVTVVADWVENSIHLAQLKRFRDNHEVNEKAITLASRATVLKLWGFVLGGIAIVILLALLVVARGAAIGTPEPGTTWCEHALAEEPCPDDPCCDCPEPSS